MKLDLKKRELVNLSHDDKKLPEDLTPQVGGGGTVRTRPNTGLACYTRYNCDNTNRCNSHGCEGEVEK